MIQKQHTHKISTELHNKERERIQRNHERKKYIKQHRFPVKGILF